MFVHDQVLVWDEFRTAYIGVQGFKDSKQSFCRGQKTRVLQNGPSFNLFGHLLTFMLFQAWMIFFLLGKQNIFLRASDPIDFHCRNTKLPKHFSKYSTEERVTQVSNHTMVISFLFELSI